MLVTGDNMKKLFGWLNYMRYHDMHDITHTIFKNSPLGKCNEVNCYIDLGSLAQMIYNNPTIKINDPRELSSCILNYAGYIRDYFRIYHNVYATIFMVFSDNEWKILKDICHDYLSRSNKKANYKEYKYVHDSMDIIKMISHYLPNVYYIESECETDGVILATIWKENSIGNDNPNIVFGRNINLVQLPILDERTYFYYKKIHLGYTASYGVTRKNALISYLKFTNRYNPIYEKDGMVFIQIGKSIDDTKFLNKTNRIISVGNAINKFIPDYLSAFIALVGFPGRNIPSKLNWQSAIECLSNFNVFIDDPLWIYNNAPFSKRLYTRLGYEDFTNRYKAVDVKFHANMYKMSLDYQIDYRINLQDSTELKYVNDHYFTNNDFIDLNKF